MPRARSSSTRGGRQPFQELLERLRGLDYDSEAVCESPGHYAVRGGIIDVYPVTATEPYRLDFFGDEIEDIRAFDPVTQRSGARVERISVAASPRVQAGVRQDRHLRLPGPALPHRLHRARRPRGGVQGVRGRRRRRPRPAPFKVRRCLRLSEIDEASAIFAEPASETVWDTESLEHHRSMASGEPARARPPPGRGRRQAGVPRPACRLEEARASASPSPRRRKARRSASARSSSELPGLSGHRPRLPAREPERGVPADGAKGRRARPSRGGRAALSSSRRRRSSGARGRGAQAQGGARTSQSPRSTSCSISPSWWRATSSSTSSTGSLSTAASRRSTRRRAFAR